MKKIILVATILVIIFSLTPIFTTKAAAPTGTLTGTVITVDIGQILAINQITVTDAAVAEIVTGNDICIKIQASTNANWDVADTSPTFGGTASGKVGVAVSYPNAKTLKIDVTTNFANNDTLTISDLSYIGHTAASTGAVLQWAIDNTDCTAATYGNANANTAITVADGTEDTLTGVSTTLNSYNGGISANHTIAFTIPATGVIPADGKIKVTFPAGFNVTSAAAGALTGIDGTVALAVSGQDVTLTRQNDGTNSSAGAKSVVINNIVNPIAGGSSTLTVRTDTSGDALLATATSDSFFIYGSGGGGGGGLGSWRDSIAPTSTITNPIDGTTIPAGEPYTIKGTAKDEGGSLVKEVEVSLDGGETWQPTEIKSVIANVFSWEYVWQNPTEGSYVIQSRATDDFGNIEVSGAGMKVTVVVPSASAPSLTPSEKPITEMTDQELKAKITEVQQEIIDLLEQLIQLIQQQIQELLA